MANEHDHNVGFLWAGVRRKDPTGLTGIYCRQCGRPIARMLRPTITTVSKCALCVAREQGIDDPEKCVLPRYLVTDPSQPPIPLEDGDPMEALYPDGDPLAEELKKKPPMVTGMMGTAKAVFRAVVGWFGQEEEPKPKEAPLSKKITREKRKGGLYERE